MAAHAYHPSTQEAGTRGLSQEASLVYYEKPCLYSQWTSHSHLWGREGQTYRQTDPGQVCLISSCFLPIGWKNCRLISVLLVCCTDDTWSQHGQAVVHCTATCGPLWIRGSLMFCGPVCPLPLTSPVYFMGVHGTLTTCVSWILSIFCPFHLCLAHMFCSLALCIYLAWHKIFPVIEIVS